MNQSISSILGNAKMKLTGTLNTIIEENKLPSQLYESVLLEMLIEIKQAKFAELISENAQLHSRISELEKGEPNEK